MRGRCEPNSFPVDKDALPSSLSRFSVTSVAGLTLLRVRGRLWEISTSLKIPNPHRVAPGQNTDIVCSAPPVSAGRSVLWQQKHVMPSRF